MVFIPVHAEQKPYFFSNIDQCLKKIPSKLTPKQKKIRKKIKKSDLRLNYNPKIHFQKNRKENDWRVQIKGQLQEVELIAILKQQKLCLYKTFHVLNWFQKEWKFHKAFEFVWRHHSICGCESWTKKSYFNKFEPLAISASMIGLGSH